MIKLDKLALAVPRELISNWRGNKRSYESRYTNLPYHLLIKYDNIYRNYKVEFSAKILGDRYCELINADNIRDCLDKINSIGICQIDVDGVLNEAYVIGADFTKDVPFSNIPNADNFKDVKSIARLSIRNYDRWNCANYKGGGLVISNSVDDSRRRKRLTIYYKRDELELAKNRPFLRSVNDSERLKEYFDGKARFELRATTKQQLRAWLDIRNLSITNVLNSTSNPLELVMSEMFHPIFAVDDAQIRRTLTNLDKLSTLKLHNWDLAEVEAHVRSSTSRSIQEGMKPYYKLYEAYKVSHNVNIVDAVRD